MPMERFQHTLLSHLRYITPIVDNYTIYPRTEGSVDAYARLVDGLSVEQINEIARVYEQIDAQGRARDLSNWIEQQGSAKPREWELFLLFRALARRGISPFVDDTVQYDLGPIHLDWTKLPADFQYLCRPAMRFGIYQFDEHIQRLAREISEEESAELAQLARRVRQAGELERLWSWRQQHRESPEEQLIAGLIQVIQEIVPRSIG